jgi:tetraacyldisaccharide 4'-kinase
LLAACRRRNIPVAVVGGRAGPGLRRLRAIPGAWNAVTRDVRWLPADAAAAALGGGRPMGELKREAPRPPPVLSWGRDAIVAGCTYDGEEQMVLDAVGLLVPRPLLVIAPREPRRFDTVATLLSDRNERFRRRTELGGHVPDEVDVVLLDTVGELAGLYGQARAAFIGGTFSSRVRGHSPAEAQAAGCPVVHGPFTDGHSAAYAELETFPALAPVDLAPAFAEAFAARPALPRAGAAAHAAALLGPLLSAPTPPERPLRPWLYPIAPFWALAAHLRPRPLVKAPIPVVSVGGLTAGGSGKTPVAAWLAERLRDRHPVVVGRGYKRRAGDDVRLDGEAVDLGDELAMLARRGIAVASAPDRLAGIQAAAKAGAKLAILDDGLQWGGVARDLEVVVIDARWPTGGGPIPVGSARLPVSWLSKADVVWVNHGPLPPQLRPHVRPDAVIVQARYRPAAWLFHGVRVPLSDLPSLPGVAFAGIARPEGFFQSLRNLGIRLDRTWIFPDHHHFVWTDLHNIEAWLDDHVVLTTEKDAARLPPSTAVRALILDVEVVSGLEELEARLAKLGG